MKGRRLVFFFLSDRTQPSSNRSAADVLRAECSERKETEWDAHMDFIVLRSAWTMLRVMQKADWDDVVRKRQLFLPQAEQGPCAKKRNCGAVVCTNA